MKQSLISMSILAATVLFVLGARADDLPKRPDFSRYAPMLEHSPFAVASSAPLPAATPDWSKDLYIANAAHTDEADYVTVISASDKSLHEYLSTIEPNRDGYSIANITWSDRPGETKVTISKNGQYATLGFNQALVSSAPSPMTPAAPSMIPSTGAPTPVPGYVPRANGGTPMPRVRGVIERNPRSGIPLPPPAPAPPPAAQQ